MLIRRIESSQAGAYFAFVFPSADAVPRGRTSLVGADARADVPLGRLALSRERWLDEIARPDSVGRDERERDVWCFLELLSIERGQVLPCLGLTRKLS